MKNATFTSCLQGDNAWAIDASEIRQYVKEEYAEMWHARFKVHGIPVFYTPYLQLPIGDRRRSGLLIPSAGTSSRDGLWYAQPNLLEYRTLITILLLPRNICLAVVGKQMGNFAI